MKMNQMLVLLGALTFVGCDDVGDDDKDTGLESGLFETDETDVQETDVEETDVEETDVEESPAPKWNEDFWTTDWKDFIDCAAGEVVLTAETKGFAGDAELYITQTDDFGDSAAWGELHTLTETEAGGSGDSAFSTLSRTLATGVDLGDFEADTNTLFMCAADNPGEDRAALDPSSDEFEATFALAVWDEDDDPSVDAPSDCLVFGQAAQALLDDPSSNERIAVPEWLNDDNCRVVE